MPNAAYELPYEGAKEMLLVDDSGVEEFDKNFPPKQKLKLPGQLFD